jgi:hypothetical protein
MFSQKYPRTFHFPFSPGTTSDDRIAPNFDSVCEAEIVITEKLDGENSCLNQYGVFSRTHSTPTKNPWASYLWERWNLLHNELGDLEIFGESLFALHSIEYTGLKEYFYIFAIREGERWLAWEQVKMYAEILQIPTVPILYEGKVQDLLIADNQLVSPKKSTLFTKPQKLQAFIETTVNQASLLSDEAIFTSPKEGLVVRLAREFTTAEFAESVFKWVRHNHVQTDEHWTKNWQRAKLNYEWQAIRQKQLKNLADIKAQSR